MIFTKNGGSIVNFGQVKDGYWVKKNGDVEGTGEVTKFDRTGNTYGMEAWIFVGDKNTNEGFSRPAVVP